MGEYHHIARNDSDAPHANNPYRVVYTPDEDLGDFQLVEGGMHSEYATFVSASDILASERWREHLRRADAEWLIPYLERMADGEDVPTAEILRAYDHDRARQWAEHVGPTTRDDERAAAAEYDIPPDPERIDEIRDALGDELDRPDAETDWPLVRLYCVLLFAHGDPADAPLVWRAEDAAPSYAGGIGVELLCGAGLERTMAALERDSSADAEAALATLSWYIEDSVFSGTRFDDFSPADEVASWQAYYGVGPAE